MSMWGILALNLYFVISPHFSTKSIHICFYTVCGNIIEFSSRDLFKVPPTQAKRCQRNHVILPSRALPPMDKWWRITWKENRFLILEVCSSDLCFFLIGQYCMNSANNHNSANARAQRLFCSIAWLGLFSFPMPTRTLTYQILYFCLVSTLWNNTPLKRQRSMRCNIITKDFFEIDDASGIKDACHE